MGMLDNLSDKAKDMMDDPDKKAQIEQMARDKNISIEEAKQDFLKRKTQQ